MTLGDLLSAAKNLGTKAETTIGSLLSSAGKKVATGAKTVGDLFNAASSPVNGPAASTIPGIAANTVAGLPKAAAGVAKDIAHGAARFAYSAGEAIPEIPLEAYSLATGGKGPQVPVYEPKAIPGLGFLGPVESYQNAAKRAVASGESPISAILKGAGGAVTDEPTGIALKPLAIAGHALAPVLGAFIKDTGAKFTAEGLEKLTQEMYPGINLTYEKGSYTAPTKVPLENIKPSQAGEDMYNETSDLYAKGGYSTFEKPGGGGKETFHPGGETITDSSQLPPIVVDTQGRIIDGNHRYAAAQAAGLKDIPVVVKLDSKAGAAAKAAPKDTTLYHTTTPEAAASIKKNGFQPVPAEDQIGQAFGEGAYFSTTPEEADAWKQFVTNDGQGEVLKVESKLNIYDPKTANPADYWDKLAKKAGVKSNPELGQEIADAFLMGKDSMEPDVYDEAIARAKAIIEGLKAKGIDGAKFVEPIDASEGITNPQVVVFNVQKVNDALKAAGKPAEKVAAEAAAGDVSRETPESVGSMRSIGDLLKNGGGERPPAVPRETATGPIPQGPQRRFIQRAGQMSPELKGMLDGSYKARNTAELEANADKLIAEDPAAATKLAIEGTDDNAVAVASRLIDTYVNDAKAATSDLTKNDAYEKAAEIANAAAKTLTEHGRAVQAASILGKLTPEGMVRYAARQIQKHNEQAGASFLDRMGKGALGSSKKKIPELTGEQAGKIADAMQKIQDMTDPDEKAKAFQELSRHVRSLLPSSTYQKVIALWKAGLLTGLKTSGLNILSNASHAAAETVKDVPAALVDRVASLFTGKRTLAMTTKGIPSGTAEGVSKGWRFFKTGYDERDALEGLDYHQVNFGKGPVAKALQAYEEKVFQTLGAEDQPFYYGAKARSLYSQAIAQGKNEGLKGAALGKRVNELVANPTDQMLKYAVMDAQTAVFQNKTALGAVARAIQKAPGGEILLPFGKTPSAVATQMINYTPVGAVAHIIQQIKHVKAGGSFDQRLFSQAIGRGLTGTGVLAIGAALADKGLITGSYPTSEKEQKQWQLEGKQANAIKIGGQWRGVGVLGPLGMVLSIGAALGQGIKDTGSFIGALGQAAAAGGSALTQQSFLYGINQAINALNDPTRYGATFINNTIGSIIPTIIADVARATDTNERQTNTATQRLVSRIPGLRELLQPQVDTLGAKIQTAPFLTVMADPTRPYQPTQDVNDPVVKELRRLDDAGYNVTPTMLGTKQGFKTLSGKQNTDLWVNAGTAAKKAITDITADPVYATLDDEQKSKLVSKVVDDAETQARARAVLSATKGLSGPALDAKIKEMFDDKLLTKTVYKWYAALGGTGAYPLQK